MKRLLSLSSDGYTAVLPGLLACGWRFQSDAVGVGGPSIGPDNSLELRKKAHAESLRALAEQQSRDAGAAGPGPSNSFPSQEPPQIMKTLGAWFGRDSTRAGREAGEQRPSKSSSALTSRGMPGDRAFLRSYRKKDPWGHNQLRDAWSEEAMSRHDGDSIDRRLHSEYRYNPFEEERRFMRYILLSMPPSWIIGGSAVYYYLYEKYPWQADYQHLINIIRQFDQSPRSKFYLYKTNVVKKGTFGPWLPEERSTAARMP